jgi:hypothetical protein
VYKDVSNVKIRTFAERVTRATSCLQMANVFYQEHSLIVNYLASEIAVSAANPPLGLGKIGVRK